MKSTSAQTLCLHLTLILAANLAAAQEFAPAPGANHEREQEQTLFFLNNVRPAPAPKAAIGGDGEPRPKQELGLSQLIKSSFGPGSRLGDESAARRQQRRIEQQLGELIGEALDEHRRQRLVACRRQQVQQQQPQVVLNRRVLFEHMEPVLEQLNKNFDTTANSNNNDDDPQGRRQADGEQPTRLLMVRQLDGLAGGELRAAGLAERKRRVSSVLPNHTQSRSLTSLNSQQLNALQSLNSLLDPDYARAYKPKIISTARGFGK